MEQIDTTRTACSTELNLKPQPDKWGGGAVEVAKAAVGVKVVEAVKVANVVVLPSKTNSCHFINHPTTNVGDFIPVSHSISLFRCLFSWSAWYGKWILAKSSSKTHGHRGRDFAVRRCIGGDASDWNRFRGPNGSESAQIRLLHGRMECHEEHCLENGTAGPGASSPIVVGDKVIVTAGPVMAPTDRISAKWNNSSETSSASIAPMARFSGITLKRQAAGRRVPRHVRRTWILISHPVSDGENVYVFLGKSGVLALSIADGSVLWKADVGDKLGVQQWVPPAVRS